MSTAAADQAEQAPAVPDQTTLLHRAVTRISQEFLGTAEGEPSRQIITFAIPGFPEGAPEDARRRTYEQVRAVIGAELAAILEQLPSVPELVAAITEAMDRLRTSSTGLGADAREAYAALTDSVDAVVYYNRPPGPARPRVRRAA